MWNAAAGQGGRQRLSPTRNPANADPANATAIFHYGEFITLYHYVRQQQMLCAVRQQACKAWGSPHCFPEHLLVSIRRGVLRLVAAFALLPSCFRAWRSVRLFRFEFSGGSYRPRVPLQQRRYSTEPLLSSGRVCVGMSGSNRFRWPASRRPPVPSGQPWRPASRSAPSI